MLVYINRLWFNSENDSMSSHSPRSKSPLNMNKQVAIDGFPSSDLLSMQATHFEFKGSTITIYLQDQMALHVSKSMEETNQLMESSPNNCYRFPKY